MIIHFPELEIINGQSILSARIESKANLHHLPKTLWFSFPQKYETDIPLRGDAFLSGAFLAASLLGEDIEVKAPVSPKLVNGLAEIQKIFNIWLPDNITPIKILCPNLEAPSPTKTKREVASLFSGGVDSSFILWANIPPQQPLEDFQIKHSLFMHGADIPFSQTERFNFLTELFSNSLDHIGVNLIPCATNVRAMTEGLLKWDYTHGAGMLACGLVLSGLLKRLYIASSFNYRNLTPWGSSPLIDNWFSTESLDIIHYGASYRRTEKIKAIANWETVQEHLRVCSSLDSEVDVNCSRCNKCLGTMSILDMEKSLHKFNTFKEPFTARKFLRWALIIDPHSVIPLFVVRQAYLERHWRVLPFALIVYLGRIIRSLLNRLLPLWLRKILRKRYYPLEKNPFYGNNLQS
ncbi:MAG: hypothetical protein FVQ83_13950 [Chloroflexi bacterium]|nr:hypothetical protein [Chloroflexota bacterium]